MPVICTPTNIVYQFLLFNQSKEFKQSFVILHPYKRKVLSRAWIESTALYCYYSLYSARRTRLQTVTLVSTSLHMNGYNGTLHWRLFALMSASSAIRSAPEGSPLVCLTWGTSIAVDVAEIVRHPALAQLRVTNEMSKYANNLAPGEQTYIMVDWD
jgi:hypothetical protein